MMLAMLAFLPHIVQQDAPRLIAIERIRRSLMDQGTASPFAEGIGLRLVPFRRPTTAFMGITDQLFAPETAYRIFVAGSTLVALLGWLWFAFGLRRSRRWFVALLLPLVFHRTHYYGFADYNLGLAMVPWGLGAALRLQRPAVFRAKGRGLISTTVLLGSSVVCGMAHQIAIIPYAVFIGVLGCAMWRKPARAGLVIGAALLSGIIAVVAPMLVSGSAVTPRLWPWSWPPSIDVVLAALDSTDPSAGPLKGLHLLALLITVLGLIGYRRASAAESAERSLPVRSLFATRFRYSSRSFGGPIPQILLFASFVLLAAYVVLPSRMAPVSFVSLRLIPFVILGIVVALPSRSGPNVRLMVTGVVLLWLATSVLQLSAQRDFGGLSEIADHLDEGTWVKVLVPTREQVPTFPYVSPFFAWDEAGVLEPIARAGALTTDLYIPPGTFAIGYNADSIPLMWKAGTASRWGQADIAVLQREMPAILFAGLGEEDVRVVLDRSVPGELVEGPNWTIWKRTRVSR